MDYQLKLLQKGLGNNLTLDKTDTLVELDLQWLAIGLSRDSNDKRAELEQRRATARHQLLKRKK